MTTPPSVAASQDGTPTPTHHRQCEYLMPIRVGGIAAPCTCGFDEAIPAAPTPSSETPQEEPTLQRHPSYRCQYAELDLQCVLVWDHSGDHLLSESPAVVPSDAPDERLRELAPTLRDVQRINDARKKRWHEGGEREWSVLEWAGAMCGEAGEAANVAKKVLRIDLGLRGNEAAEHVITERDALLKKLGGEIGGTVLYAALLASAVGLDFESLIVSTFNDKSVAMGFPERLDVDRDDDWMSEILGMVRERLAAYLGEESMKGTPPMFYDDAISSIAHKAAFGKLPEEMYPEGSLLHRLREAEAERDSLRSEIAALRETQQQYVSRAIDEGMSKARDRIFQEVLESDVVPLRRELAALREDKADAERWRYVRQLFSVEYDGENRGQYLFMHDDTASTWDITFLKGYDNTVESLIDARRAARSEKPT